MANRLDMICKDLLTQLEEKDETREGIIRESRHLLRLSGQVITDLIRGDRGRNHLSEARKVWADMRSRVSMHPDLMYSGLLDSALEEYAEAEILFSLVTGSEIPTNKVLNIPPQVYLGGMADCIGELRRLVLSELDKSNLKKASGYFEMMCGIYDHLMMFDIPSSLYPLRRKQDIARSIIERTQGDLTLGKIMLPKRKNRQNNKKS